MRRFTILLLILIGGTGLVWPQGSETEMFSEAESRYLGKNYAAALDAYDSLLKRFPLSNLAADVQYRKAVCLFRLEKFQEASQLLHDVETKFRSTRYLDFVSFWQGLSFYQLKSYSRSVEYLDTFLAAKQDQELTPQALLYKALSLVELKSFPEAVGAVERIYKEFSGSEVFPYSAVLLASLLRKEKRYDDLVEFTRGIDPSGFPQNWKEQFLLARADGFWETGKSDDAVVLYRSLVAGESSVALTSYRRLFAAAQKKADLAEMRALTRAAETRFTSNSEVLTDLWTRVGVESFRRGSLDDAKSFLLKVWDLRKTLPPPEAVPLYLAEISLSRKDPVSARALLEEYVASNGSTSQSAIIRLGDIALSAGDLAGAEKWYSRLIEADPDSPRLVEAGYLLAYVKYRRGRYEEAYSLATEYLQKPTVGQFRKDLLRLRIMLLKKGGSYQEAAASLAEYTVQYPDDVRSRIDYLKVLYVLKSYSKIVTEANAISAKFPALASADPYSHLLTSYLRGLGLIAQKEYRGAVRDLESIRRDVAEKAGLSSILPFAGYYLGWAYVKSGSFDRAAKTLDDLAAAYPGHELSPKILFLAGWSRFNLGEYDRAAETYTRAARVGTAEIAAKSLYLSAKSLFNAKKLPEALSAFQAILRATPASQYADSAMFDSAGVLAEQGQTAKAAETYLSLTSMFPGSSLAEDAMYKRAETYFEGGMLASAKTAFADYRNRFPKGKLVDSALYWGGESAVGAGEKFGAVLLWGELIKGFPKSNLRAIAVRKSAEVYAEARDFSAALTLYTQLIAEYPEEARSSKADITAERLHYQILGFGDREAELTATISRSSGAEKNTATLELARMYILSGEKKVDEGYRMVQGLVSSQDPATASMALSLAGEYFYRKGDLVEASRRFVSAASKAASDAEFAASSLYRAAEMMKLAKRQDEVQAIVKRLTDNFPSSPWTAKARGLMEAGK
jgi:TolA-binding protein